MDGVLYLGILMMYIKNKCGYTPKLLGIDDNEELAVYKYVSEHFRYYAYGTKYIKDLI